MPPQTTPPQLTIALLILIYFDLKTLSVYLVPNAVICMLKREGVFPVQHLFTIFLLTTTIDRALPGRAFCCGCRPEQAAKVKVIPAINNGFGIIDLIRFITILNRFKPVQKYRFKQFFMPRQYVSPSKPGTRLRQWQFNFQLLPALPRQPIV